MAVRLNYELKSLLKKGWSIETPEDNLFEWDVVFEGPKACDSAYEGGVWLVKITFPNDYPYSPPEVKFSTKIFHPNVSSKGEVCIKSITDEWSPKKTMENSVLSFIEGLLVAPDSGNPMNPEADVLFRTNREEFDKKVDVWKRKYAS